MLQSTLCKLLFSVACFTINVHGLSIPHGDVSQRPTANALDLAVPVVKNQHSSEQIGHDPKHVGNTVDKLHLDGHVRQPSVKSQYTILPKHLKDLCDSQYKQLEQQPDALGILKKYVSFDFKSLHNTMGVASNMQNMLPTMYDNLEGTKGMINIINRFNKGDLCRPIYSVDLYCVVDRAERSGATKKVFENATLLNSAILSLPTLKQPITVYRHIDPNASHDGTKMTDAVAKYLQVGRIIPITSFTSTNLIPNIPRGNRFFLLKIDIPAGFPIVVLKGALEEGSYLSEREVLLPYTLDKTGMSLNYGFEILGYEKIETADKLPGYIHVRPKRLDKAIPLKPENIPV